MKYERIPNRKSPFRGMVETSREAAQIFAAALRDGSVEQLWVLPIDPECRPLGVWLVGVGSETGVWVDAAVVLGAVRRSGADSFVLGHNHPAGDPLPSLDDWMTTQELLQESAKAGLELVDHVVLGDGVYVSMRASNEPMFERGCP